MDIEERYTTLQEENAAKTKKLKRVVQLLNSAKAELADQMREQQREMEGILDNIRALKREIQLADLVLDSYIPKEYQVCFYLLCFYIYHGRQILLNISHYYLNRNYWNNIFIGMKILGNGK